MWIKDLREKSRKTEINEYIICICKFVKKEDSYEYFIVYIMIEINYLKALTRQTHMYLKYSFLTCKINQIFHIKF